MHSETHEKVLITGAGGFIGFELAHRLARSGHPVIGVDLRYPRQAAAVPFDARVVDFRDGAKMRRLLQGVGIVFHLASAHLDVSLDEAAYWDVNVRSLPKLLETTRAAGVGRFIHVSSVGVYGSLQAWPADEKTACHPQSIYGETKLAGEGEVEKFRKETGFQTTILRPTWVYGPTCPRTRKLYRSLKNRRFVMVGRGDNLRHPVYIEDLLDAFEAAMISERVVGELLIVGGERALTTRELIETMCAVFRFKRPAIRIPYPVGKSLAVGTEAAFGLLGKPPPVSRRTLEFFDTNNAFDISKARDLLAFQPRFSLAQGLDDCREALAAAA